MKLLSVTIESSITKNLGNYQSTKQIVSFVIELGREITTMDELNETQVDLAYVGFMVKNQLMEQIRQSIEAINDDSPKPF